MSFVDLLDLSTFASVAATPVPDDDRADAPERDEWDAETIDETPEALEWADAAARDVEATRQAS